MEILKWLGLQNTTAPERLKPGHLEVAKDVDIDGGGVLSTRSGMTQVSATAAHSMFSAGDVCLVAQGNVLKRFTPPGTLEALRTLTYGGPVAYAEAGDVIYFTNNVDTGRVVAGVAKEWGVRRPPAQPAASPDFGLLPPGRYLYAMTFLRGDGIESGTPEWGVIELTAQGGIMFSNIPTSSDPDVVGRVLYLSAPNGSELYQIGAVPSAATLYAYGNAGLDLGPPLHPDPVYPPPPGQALAVHAGVLYVAQGDTLWASDQYGYDRFRMSKRFLRLPGVVTMVAPVDKGIYAATDKGTWFFEGTDPEEMRARKVLDHGAVPGTVARMDGGSRAAGDEPDVPSTPSVVWMSTVGVAVGDSSGNVTLATQDDYGIPPGTRGAALVRLQGGNVTYLATTRGNASSGNQHS